MRSGTSRAGASGRGSSSSRTRTICSISETSRCSRSRSAVSVLSGPMDRYLSSRTIPPGSPAAVRGHLPCPRPDGAFGSTAVRSRTRCGTWRRARSRSAFSRVNAYSAERRPEQHPSVRVRAALGRKDAQPVDEFLHALYDADIFVSSGAGAFNDEFASLAISILDLLQMAKETGAVTAVLGHGVGPITEPALLRRAREVLPGIDIVTLQGGRRRQAAARFARRSGGSNLRHR